MDREEIIRMAREAGAAVDVSTDPNSPPSWWAAGHNDVWERFAELVAAKEREACAQICDQEVARWGFHAVAPSAAAGCAVLIRARGATDGK